MTSLHPSTLRRQKKSEPVSGTGSETTTSRSPERDEAATETAADEAETEAGDPAHRAVDVLRRRDDLVVAELARACDRHLAELVADHDGDRLTQR
jgi:hypothetical protein